MDKVTFIDVEEITGTVTHAVIEREDGSFMVMEKAIWDELEAQREQSGTL